MKGYKITKRGKKAIFTMAFLIVFLIVNLSFRLYANAYNSIKVSDVNDKTADNQRIALSNKQGNTKAYEEKQTVVTSSSPIVSDAKATSETQKIEIPTEVENKFLVDKQELSYAVESAYVKDGKKIAFLSFDDGPSIKNTTKILDILKTYQIKATFFIVGSSAEKNPDILKTVANDGHAIGNHTYSHNYKVIYSNVDTFIGEIEKTEGIFKNILGSDFNSRLVRFPGGAFETPSMKPYKKELSDRGYVNIDWNVINGDGEGHNIPADKLFDKLKKTSMNHSHLVILMHDSATKQTTVESLPQIIEYLKAEGFEFATLK